MNWEKTVRFDSLTSWSEHKVDAIKYYSGTAHYFKTFEYAQKNNQNNIWLSLGEVDNIATVKVNGINCGTVWTYPYKVNITNAIKSGKNTLDIAVTNTWANRLIGDQKLPEEERETWTSAPYYLTGKPLLKGGLLGSVILEVSK